MSTQTDYLPNTPQKNLSWDKWQIQFQQNFRQLALAFSQNHIALNDATTANRGNHTYIQMPQQSQDVQTNADEFAIYTRNVEEQTNQIFCTFPGNTPVVQFTNYQIYTLIQPDTYFTFLPGKLIVYFGTFNPTTKDTTIFLKPPVAKNIISMNFCNIGNPIAPFNTPSASILAEENGIIKGVELGYTAITGQILPIYYVIMANI